MHVAAPDSILSILRLIYNLFHFPQSWREPLLAPVAAFVSWVFAVPMGLVGEGLHEFLGRSCRPHLFPAEVIRLCRERNKRRAVGDCGLDSLKNQTQLTLRWVRVIAHVKRKTHCPLPTVQMLQGSSLHRNSLLA